MKLKIKMPDEQNTGSVDREVHTSSYTYVQIEEMMRPNPPPRVEIRIWIERERGVRMCVVFHAGTRTRLIPPEQGRNAYVRRRERRARERREQREKRAQQAGKVLFRPMQTVPVKSFCVKRARTGQLRENWLHV